VSGDCVRCCRRIDWTIELDATEWEVLEDGSMFARRASPRGAAGALRRSRGGARTDCERCRRRSRRGFPDEVHGWIEVDDGGLICLAARPTKIESWTTSARRSHSSSWTSPAGRNPISNSRFLATWQRLWPDDTRANNPRYLPHGTTWQRSAGQAVSHWVAPPIIQGTGVFDKVDLLAATTESTVRRKSIKRWREILPMRARTCLRRPSFRDRAG